LQEVAELHRQKARLEDYQKYLDMFQRACPEEFPEIAAVLERYKTLTTARFDLLAEKSRLTDGVEDQRKVLTRVQKAASTQVLSSETVVQKMKERVEGMRAMVQALQQGAEEATNVKGGQVLELGQVLQCVHNLHLRCTLSLTGQVVKHTPADGEVLGFSEFDGALADPDDTAATAAAALAHLDAVQAAVEAGKDIPAPPSPTKPPAPKDIVGMDVNVLRKRLREAVGLLHVVGSYIQDFEGVTTGFTAWIGEQKRKSHEREVAVAAEANRIAAAKAARTGKHAPLLPGQSKQKTTQTKMKLNLPGDKAAAMSAKRNEAIGTNSSILSNSSSGLNSSSVGNSTLNATADVTPGVINVKGMKLYVVKGAKLDPEALARLAGSPQLSFGSKDLPQQGSIVTSGVYPAGGLARSTSGRPVGVSRLNSSKTPMMSPMKPRR
jgi:hypothetical protein